MMLVTVVVVHIVFGTALCAVIGLLIYHVKECEFGLEGLLVVVMAVVGAGVGSLMILLGPITTIDSPVWWTAVASIGLGLVGVLVGILLASFLDEDNLVGRCLFGALLSLLAIQILFYWIRWFEVGINGTFADAPSVVFLLCAFGAFALKAASDAYA